MLKAIKIRIYPDINQIDYINRLLGCCRFAYNKCLEYRKNSYEKHNVSLSSNETIKYLVPLKTEFDFLKDVHSKVLQQSIRDLNQSYDNFFKLHKGYPKFKSKKDNKQSCRFPKDAFIGVRGNRIDLIKCLKNIHFKCSRRDEKYLNKHQDNVLSITLSKSCSNKYYLSVLIDYQPQHKNTIGSIIGLDLGIKDFIITSDGNRYENKHFYKNEEHKLKRLNRQFSRKVNGSNNKNKMRLKIARLNEKIVNQRNNYIQQITTQLVNENQIICIEDLNVGGMVKNHHLSKSIQDCSFSKFVEVLSYKCLNYGRQLVKIDRFYPSSKTCNCCGYINKSLKLSDREWVCPDCGSIIDRDINAAKNILNEGIRIIGLSSPEFKSVDCPTMDDRLAMNLKSSDRMKQKKNVKYN